MLTVAFDARVVHRDIRQRRPIGRKTKGGGCGSYSFQEQANAGRQLAQLLAEAEWLKPPDAAVEWRSNKEKQFVFRHVFHQFNSCRPMPYS